LKVGTALRAFAHPTGAATELRRSLTIGVGALGGRSVMPKMRRKGDLPQKICAACGRPFAWRKKWARDWEQVKTCSDRCKGELRRKGADVSQLGGDRP